MFCSVNFTAIVAVEKPNYFDSGTEAKPTKDLFDLEIDEGFLENFPDTKLTVKETFQVNLSNKIRIKVEKFLDEVKLTFIEFFKSSIIKEESFINIMLKTIRIEATADDIKDFIRYKNMKLPGKGIILKPLYELVVRCRQSQGFLYIFGKNDMVPKTQYKQLATTVKHDSLSYHLINLPEAVCCSKVACGANFVLILSQTGIVYS